MLILLLGTHSCETTESTESAQLGLGCFHIHLVFFADSQGQQDVRKAKEMVSCCGFPSVVQKRQYILCQYLKRQ